MRSRESVGNQDFTKHNNKAAEQYLEIERETVAARDGELAGTLFASVGT